MDVNNVVEFWIHCDPFNKSFNQIWRSWTEPIYNPKEKAFRLKKSALRNGDMFVHLDLRTQSILPKELIEKIKPGVKAKVMLDVSYEIIEDNIQE